MDSNAVSLLSVLYIILSLLLYTTDIYVNLIITRHSNILNIINN